MKGTQGNQPTRFSDELEWIIDMISSKDALENDGHFNILITHLYDDYLPRWDIKVISSEENNSLKELLDRLHKDGCVEMYNLLSEVIEYATQGRLSEQLEDIIDVVYSENPTEAISGFDILISYLSDVGLANSDAKIISSGEVNSMGGVLDSLREGGSMQMHQLLYKALEYTTRSMLSDELEALIDSVYSVDEKEAVSAFDELVNLFEFTSISAKDLEVITLTNNNSLIFLIGKLNVEQSTLLRGAVGSAVINQLVPESDSPTDSSDDLDFSAYGDSFDYSSEEYSS